MDSYEDTLSRSDLSVVIQLNTEGGWRYISSTSAGWHRTHTTRTIGHSPVCCTLTGRTTYGSCQARIDFQPSALQAEQNKESSPSFCVVFAIPCLFQIKRGRKSRAVGRQAASRGLHASQPRRLVCRVVVVRVVAKRSIQSSTLVPVFAGRTIRSAVLGRNLKSVTSGFGSTVNGCPSAGDRNLNLLT